MSINSGTDKNGSMITMRKRTIAAIVVITIALTVILVVVVIPKCSNLISTWNSNDLLAFITFLGVIIAIIAPCISHLFSAMREENHRNWQKAHDDERDKEQKEQQAEFNKNRLEWLTERDKSQRTWQEERDKEQREWLDLKRKECQSAVYLIDIGVKTLENNFVLFSASIHNIGDIQIETIIANLYIDQGKKHSLTNDRNSSDVGVSYYQFPFILEHKETIDGRPDCVLCKKCFREHTSDYPEECVDQALKGDKELLRTHYELQHLSNKSIKYINPKEKFSEDVIVQFKEKGVYRVTLFVGAAETADCCCATKQFYIPKSLEE